MSAVLQSCAVCEINTIPLKFFNLLIFYDKTKFYGRLLIRIYSKHRRGTWCLRMFEPSVTNRNNSSRHWKCGWISKVNCILLIGYGEKIIIIFRYGKVLSKLKYNKKRDTAGLEEKFRKHVNNDIEFNFYYYLFSFLTTSIKY